jgi:hypothetical protein
LVTQSLELIENTLNHSFLEMKAGMVEPLSLVSVSTQSEYCRAQRTIHLTPSGVVTPSTSFVTLEVFKITGKEADSSRHKSRDDTISRLDGIGHGFQFLTFVSRLRFRDSDSNVIGESDSQDEKHDEQRESAFRGITIDSSD